MSGITSQTRQEAHEKANASERRLVVLGVILSSPEALGASEIAEKLGWDVTSVRPRLTELTDKGQIHAIGRRMLPTGRREATFSVVPKYVTQEGGQIEWSFQPSL